MLATTTAVNGGLGYLYWVLGARALTPLQVGIATAFVAAMTLTSLITNLGLGQALVTVLPRRAGRDEWSSAVTAAWVSALAAGVAGGVVAELLLRGLSNDLPRGPLVAAGIVAGCALSSAVTVIDYVFVAERRTGFVLARNGVLGVVKMLLLLVLLATNSLTGVTLFLTWVGGLAVSLGVALAVFLPRLERGSAWHLSAMTSELRVLARPAAGNLGVSLPAQVPAYALPIVVIARASVVDNGFFSIGWMLVGLLSAVSPAIATSLFAEGSHGRSLRRSIRTSAAFLAAALVPGVVVVAVGRSLWLSLFGADYAAAAATLVTLLAVATLFDAVSNVYVTVMRVLGRYAPAIAVNVGIAVVAVVGAWVLVPSAGIDGVGWAWLGAQVIFAVVALLDGWHVKRQGLIS